MVLQECDVLAHALYSFRHKFLARWRYCAYHILYVSVVEHGTMYYAASGYVIEGVARHLASFYHYVVASACFGRYSELAQHFRHHIYIFAECQTHILVGCYVREHDVGHVGVDTASSAFATIGLYVVLSAIFYVNLVLYELVASEDNSRVNLPHEEILALVEVAGNVFFHGEIECEPSFRSGII